MFRNKHLECSVYKNANADAKAETKETKRWNSKTNSSFSKFVFIKTNDKKKGIIENSLGNEYALHRKASDKLKL